MADFLRYLSKKVTACPSSHAPDLLAFSIFYPCKLLRSIKTLLAINCHDIPVFKNETIWFETNIAGQSYLFAFTANIQICEPNTSLPPFIGA